MEALEALKARVKEGNEKLNAAWDQICKIDHKSTQWAEEVERWHQANEKLSDLCTVLKAKGFHDCLFLENGVKTRSCFETGLGCRVCPSSTPYWERELMNLPSGGEKCTNLPN